MKVSEIKKCVCCGQGVAHGGHITFCHLKLQRFGLDRHAINRMAGMEQFFGGEVAIARAFCDEDVAIKIGDPDEVTICEPCGMKPKILYDYLQETSDETPPEPTPPRQIREGVEVGEDGRIGTGKGNRYD